MGKISLVTDSTADLPPSVYREYGIRMVPLYVNLRGEVYRDWVDLNPEQFYEALDRSPELPTTSQPLPEDFVAVYEELKREVEAIISVHISKEISGTYQSALMAKERVSGVEVEVVDSSFGSIGLGLMVKEAAEAARMGRDKGEILALLNTLKQRIRFLGCVPSLEYLRRGGRIGKAQAFVGTLLNVKPILAMRDGIIVPVERVRGTRKVFERVIEIMRTWLGANRTVKVGVAYGADAASRLKMVGMIENAFKCQEVVASRLGAVITTHLGPETWVVAFYPVEA